MHGSSDEGARAAGDRTRPPAGTVPSEPRLYRSTDLFGGRTEILIEHVGERYRLRCTRQGKLILTK